MMNGGSPNAVAPKPIRTSRRGLTMMFPPLRCYCESGDNRVVLRASKGKMGALMISEKQVHYELATD